MLDNKPHPVVVLIPAVMNIEYTNDKTVLRFDAVDNGADWFKIAKRTNRINHATTSAGCSIAGFDLYVDEEPSVPMLNDLADHLQAANEGLNLLGNAFIAPTPEHDEEANESFPQFNLSWLASEIYDLTWDQMTTPFDDVCIMHNGEAHRAMVWQADDPDRDQHEPTQTHSQQRQEADAEDQYYNEPRDDR